jgi:hypothetical protein
VFYDDRFDMYPDDVSDAHLALVRGGPSLRAELQTWDIELVLTPQGGAPGALLTVDPAWRPLFTDERWTLLCRRGADLGGAVGDC